MEQHNHKSTSMHDLEQLSGHLITAFPAINEQQQNMALAIYRLLAAGRPVSIEKISEVTAQAVNEIEHILHSWPGVFFDENNNITGFWGITTEEMPHHLTVNNQDIYAWCAWDTLFIPGLLGTTVNVKSTCPVTNQRIELEVSPSGVRAINNNDVVVSFVKPVLKDFTDNITSSFCHFIYFFSNHTAGEQWCAEHPNTFLLSLNDAFIVGNKVNTARYNLTLK